MTSRPSTIDHRPLNSDIIVNHNACKILKKALDSVIDFPIIHFRNMFLLPISKKKIAGIIIFYIFLVFGIAALGYFFLPARYAPSTFLSPIFHSNFLLWSWANFDGEHYLNIAKKGYQVIRGQSEYAFFPLFPLLINLVNRTGLDFYLSSHFVAFLSDIGFIVVLLKWAAKYTKNPLTLLWILLLSPGAIFFSAIYTEPLFLFLTVLTFYYADRKEWGRAALSTALATATRVNGLFLILFLLFKFLKHKVPSLRASLYLALSSFGFLAYSFYLYSQTGNAFAWYTAQSGWQKSTPTAPWTTFSSYFRALTTNFVPDLTHLVVWVEVLTTIILIYLLIYFFRQKKFDSAYKYYALANLALPLATGSLGSMPRFSLTLFPLFLVIPALPKSLRFTIISFFIISCITGIILFTRGYWYA